MQTELHHITEDQKRYLYSFIGKVVQRLSINKIVCYGIRTYKTVHWPALSSDQLQPCATRLAVDLLVVPGDDEKRLKLNISQIVENMAKPYVACTCIVHTMAEIDSAVAARDLFYSRLYYEGILLHGYQGDWRSPKGYLPCASEYLEQAAIQWEQHYERASRFYRGAGLCIRSMLPEQAIFSLHQAVEQTAMALMRAITGYRPYVHNLHSLLGLLSHVGFDSRSFFPTSMQKEKRLFALLKDSYIDSRYEDEYAVLQADADQLYRKVGLFMEMAFEAYQHRLSTWKEEVDLGISSGGCHRKA